MRALPKLFISINVYIYQTPNKANEFRDHLFTDFCHYLNHLHNKNDSPLNALKSRILNSKTVMVNIIGSKTQHQKHLLQTVTFNNFERGLPRIIPIN